MNDRKSSEHPIPNETTAAPLPAEEWLHSELANPNSDVACRWLEREAKENGVLDYLAVLLESYSTHVNSELLEKLAHSMGETNFQRISAAGNRKSADAAEARISVLQEAFDALTRIHQEFSLKYAEKVDRISVLERERDEARNENATRQEALHKKFGFVPAADNPEKCACAYCSRDVEALMDHAAELECDLFLPGGYKARAELAESQLSTLREALRTVTQMAVDQDSDGWSDEIERVAERALTPPTEPPHE